VRPTGLSRSASITLSAAYGVSWRARAESGATNQLVAIRPWEMNPFGSPVPRLCREDLAIDWRGSIATSSATGSGRPRRKTAATNSPAEPRVRAIIPRPRAERGGFMTTAAKTYQATAQDRERDWYVVDAEGKTLG